MGIKSHQTIPPRFPTEAVADGNDAQDTWCELARPLRQLSDVMLPTSPIFAFLPTGGRMLTTFPTLAIRRLLRDQAVLNLRKKRVQGKFASLGQSLYKGALEPMICTQVSTPPAWPRMPC
jgi:hypothetical protein